MYLHYMLNKIIVLDCAVVKWHQFQWQECNEVIVVFSGFHGPAARETSRKNVDRYTLTFMSVKLSD